MRNLFHYVLILLFVSALLGMGVERFTSTGTLIQLQTSHVPELFVAGVPDDKERAASKPDECVTGSYRCVYKSIPFGFMP